MFALTWLLAAASAAEVACSPADALALVASAGILPHRAPLSHPELIPALALSSDTTSPEARSAISELCGAGGYLSLVPAETWQGADWSANTFVLSRTVQQSCTLVREAIAISVGVVGEQAPTYALRGTLPVTQTPTGSCSTDATWQEERLLGGSQSPVRLVLVSEMLAGEVQRTAIVARRATPAGWTEDVLLDPAPPRLLGGYDGPAVSLHTVDDVPWVVVHGFRTEQDGDCLPRGGQTVWTHSSEGWSANRGRAGLALLAERGAWRLAGDNAWFLIVSVLPEDASPEVRADSLERLQRRSAERLYLLPSASFPGFNPGFWVIAPAPWPTEGEARDALRRWRSWRRAYVKQGWTAPPACGPPTM